MPESPAPSEPEGAWERGWEGHERAQLRRWAAIPFREKLRGIEEMRRLADEIARRRRERGLPVYGDRREG